jgi:hypothetical protein
LICLIVLDFGSRHPRPNQGNFSFPDVTNDVLMYYVLFRIISLLGASHGTFVHVTSTHSLNYLKLPNDNG